MSISVGRFVRSGCVRAQDPKDRPGGSAVEIQIFPFPVCSLKQITDSQFVAIQDSLPSQGGGLGRRLAHSAYQKIPLR